MSNFNNKYSEEEWTNRVNLAACYHLADHFGFSDIIWNHITTRTEKNKDTFLINPFGLRYDEVTASNLIEINLDGKIINGEHKINETGYIIHGAIHKSRKDVNCVMHTHSRAGLAISCLDEGLIPMIQDSAMFYNRVSYHDWEGMSTNAEECEKISKDLENGIMPNLIGMKLRDVLPVCENNNIKIQFEGSGNVIFQSIDQGERIKKYDIIRIKLS